MSVRELPEPSPRWIVSWAERSTVGVAVFDEGLCHVAANEAFAVITGLPRDALLGRTLVELFPEAPPEGLAMMRDVLATRQPIAGRELMVALPGRRARYWSASVFPVDGPGGARGVGIAVEEITTRKNAEIHLDLLLEAKDLLSGAFETETVLARLERVLVPRLADFAVVDLKRGESLEVTAVVHADPAKAALVRDLRRHDPPRPDDRTGALHVARTGRAVMQGEVDDAFLVARARSPEHLRRMRALGVRSVMTVPMRAGARTLGAITLASTNPLRHYDEIDLSLAQTVADHAGIAVDMALRHQAELESAERTRVLAEAGALLATSPDYGAVADHVARLLVPALVDTCSIDLLDASGRPDRYSVADVDPQREAMLREQRRRYTPRVETHPLYEAMRAGRSRLIPWTSEEAMRTVAHDAEHLRVLRELAVPSLLLVPLMAQGRAVGGMAIGRFERGFTPEDVAFLEDLARRAALAVENARLHLAERRARLEAEHANRAKDEFLGVVSHELRTPLNAVIGWTNLLRGRASSDPWVARALEVIDRNARAQAKIIEDILDASRIVAGRLVIERAPVDLAAVLRTAVEGVRLAAESKGVAIEVVAREAGPFVVGDADRLRQVVSNLLVNAVKFTPSGGRIEAAIEPGPDAVHVSVADTGIGIDPDVLPHVFERFRQADSSPARRHGGVGLGLAIVRQIVELHGGSVAAESGGVGKGARFTVVLPAPSAADRLAARASAPPPVVAADPPPASVERLRVLIVDDDVDAREVVAATLASRGAIVHAVESAEAAIRALPDFGPDVLLSDIGMPGEDGFALLRRVRALPPPFSRVPAVALTAYTRDEDAKRAIGEGFFAHVPKPIETARMLAALVRAAGRTAE